MKISQGCKLELDDSDIEEFIKQGIENKMNELGCVLTRIDRQHPYPEVTAHGITEAI
tara:strand:- start:880 stop:1050 length:171 start_codon:yes stop_codon:yes gene_type:complete